MAAYDIFNGDADGMSALIQLRLVEPKKSQLITGVKRAIDLVKQVRVQAGDELTVLDVALEKNHSAVQQALAQGAYVFYVDHHAHGEMIEHQNFTKLINTAPNVCTSLLVNRYLKNAFPLWAIVGAFGDNLKTSASALAKTTDLTTQQLASLNELGVLLNYNAYGLSVEDLHFAPQHLFSELLQFSSPLYFLKSAVQTYSALQQGYADDMAHAMQTPSYFHSEKVAVFVLPQAAWARRVNGVLGNDLANQFPQRAHAVLVEKPNASFMVSVRAPLHNKKGAGRFCGQFASSGGREAAAGINDLPLAALDDFIKQFIVFYK